MSAPAHDANSLHAQLTQLESAAVACASDLEALVASLNAALLEVAFVSSAGAAPRLSDASQSVDVADKYEHALQTAAADADAGVTASVATASALLAKCALLRDKAKQVDGLAKASAEIKKQLDFMVRARACVCVCVCVCVCAAGLQRATCS